MRRHLEDLRREGDDEPQAAVVIMENATGAVRALVGSGNYNDPHQGQVNGALRPRSAGSTLKPFLYLNAFDRRLLTAASILPDTAEAVRATFADYDPQNYHAGRHLGPVRVRVALGSSLNVAAVVALGRYVGARQAFYEFGRWGFRFAGGLDEYGAGFILGNAEIRLLDLADAYAGLARGGLAGRARLLARESAPLERVASADATRDHHRYPLRPAGAAGDLRGGFTIGFSRRGPRGGENRHVLRLPRQMVRGLRRPAHGGRLGGAFRRTANG